MKHLHAFMIAILACMAQANTMASVYLSDWQYIESGYFLGSEVWANPLQDWRVKDAQAQCHIAGGERNIFILSHEITPQTNYIELTTELQSLDDEAKGAVGVRLGVQGEFADFRDAAIRGTGLKVGINESGQLFIGEQVSEKIVNKNKPLKLKVAAQKVSNRYHVSLQVLDQQRVVAELTRKELAINKVTGGVGLFCHAGKNMMPERVVGKPLNTKRGGAGRYSFKYLSIKGDMKIDKSRSFGPIAFTAYTLSEKTLKMTAQMLPVPLTAGKTAQLEIQPNGSDWKLLDSADIDPDSRTAQFRVHNWSYNKDIPFRVRYEQQRIGQVPQVFFYSGKISKEPAPAEQVKVASLSCQLDKGFPHQHMVDYIASHNPDMFLFTGDQYYESNAGYGVQWSPVEAATLDYLRKWYQFGWAFRDLYRDVPSVFLADDHDYFHGNLWGDAGKKAQGKAGADIQDSGGFKMPPHWINAVQRSMTSHMPDPYDATPVMQDIGVYYTAMNYGGLSLAILEDRKWKSSPRSALPEAKIVNGFSRNLDWDARTQGDKPGLSLLGERQTQFLENWSQDWSNDARMKAVVSQTLFASAQTRPQEDIVTFKDRGMSPVKKGEYPKTDIVVQDFDTNGWPQTPRNEAIKLMSKANAFHIAGDTHLGLTLQYGTDDWQDGPWAIGSPAVSNIWPRRWFPKELPLNHQSGQARNFGNYLDGFGNKITVRAAANPRSIDIEPISINERAPGYNILIFDNQKQTVEVQAWPRWVNPQQQPEGQYPGWPITLSSLDNGYPKAGYTLINLTDLPEIGAVVQVVKDDGEVVNTMRFLQPNATIKVSDKGAYLLRIFDENMNIIRQINAKI